METTIVLDKGIFDTYEACMQDEPAATTARCPVHVEVPELCAQIAQGNFKQAYAVLQKRIPFPGVFCLVCDAPCEEACVRGALDAPLRIGHLERAAVRYGRTPYKKKFKTSKRNGAVAVVGGGISGLSAAFDLDRRGYAVTLFEGSERLGGWLWELVGEALTEEDLDQGLEAIYELAVEVRCGQFIDMPRLEQLKGEYDAVFLGTGTWPEPLTVDGELFCVGAANLFVGGTLAGTGDSVINAVSSGKRAAVTMERFIKSISLRAEREREGAFETILPKSLEYVEADCGPGSPAPQGFYSQEEASREAARCLRCECDECIKACMHLQRYGRRPKTYAREIYTNENVFLGTRYANRMINSCTLCGLCGERCPIDLNMAPLIRQTRRSMVGSDKMPPSAHDFALRDLAFSNSDQCFLVRQPPGNVSAEAAGSPKAPWMFFPGCQLAASEPGHVEGSYRWLCEILPEGVGLFLGCCGAPADWAGRDTLLKRTTDRIHTVWADEGRPTFILACSSCMDVMKRVLPDIHTVSLWQVLAERGVPSVAVRTSDKHLNVHDACSTRHDADLQTSVRHIASELGYGIEELRYAGEDTKCCGYGGLVFYAHREQEGDFVLDRAKESPHDLLVYCAMCKDLLVDAGKRSYHILDLLFAEDPDAAALKKMPSLSLRQTNRAELKRRMLHEIWGEQVSAPSVRLPGYTVTIPPEVLETMDERLILVSDVEDALVRAIADPGERFYNTAEESYLISIRKQYVTYWVRYTQMDMFIRVIGAYSHRMDIVD